VRWSKSDEQQPVFDSTDGKLNIVTVQVGQTAYLQCRVKHLGDKVVSSWLFLQYKSFETNSKNKKE
jgi:hypothetical protein